MMQMGRWTQSEWRGAHPRHFRGSPGEGAGVEQAAGQPADQDQRGGHTGLELQEDEEDKLGLKIRK